MYLSLQKRALGFARSGLSVCVVFLCMFVLAPPAAQAATVTYQAVVPDSSTNFVADGTANITASGAPIANTANMRTSMNASGYTATASRYYPTGLTVGAWVSVAKLYGPVYATDQTITSPSGSFGLRAVAASDQFRFHIYDYNPAGAAGNKVLIFSSSAVTNVATSGATMYSPTYTAQASTLIPAGHRLMLEIEVYAGTATSGQRIYLDDTATPSYARITVTETASVGTPGTLALASATYSVAETGGSIVLSVNRTSGSSGAVGVSYTTANGSASSGSDFTTTSGVLSWADGDATAKTITVPILDDLSTEGSETFNVNLSGASGGATLGSPASSTVTITDNEGGGGPQVPAGSTLLFTALAGGMAFLASRKNRRR